LFASESFLTALVIHDIVNERARGWERALKTALPLNDEGGEAFDSKPGEKEAIEKEEGRWCMGNRAMDGFFSSRARAPVNRLDTSGIVAVTPTLLPSYPLSFVVGLETSRRELGCCPCSADGQGMNCLSSGTPSISLGLFMIIGGDDRLFASAKTIGDVKALSKLSSTVNPVCGMAELDEDSSTPSIGLEGFARFCDWVHAKAITDAGDRGKLGGLSVSSTELSDGGSTPL